jgi:hypothetical protein
VRVGLTIAFESRITDCELFFDLMRTASPPDVIWETSYLPAGIVWLPIVNSKGMFATWLRDDCPFAETAALMRVNVATNTNIVILLILTCAMVASSSAN